MKTVEAKKKTPLFTGAISSKVPSKSKALTPEMHLLKQLSLRYFVDNSLTIKEVAKKLNTTPKVLKSFFEDDEYREELGSRMDRVHGVDTDFMQSQAKISLLHLYEEMRRREVEGELKDIPTRELHKILVDTSKELRLDTPGAFTSKVGVVDLSNLQDRFKKSLSGKMQRTQKKKDKLKNVSPPSGLLAERSNLSVENSNKSEARGVGQDSN